MLPVKTNLKYPVPSLSALVHMFPAVFYRGCSSCSRLNEHSSTCWKAVFEISHITAAKRADSVHGNLVSSQAHSVSAGAVWNSILGPKSYFAGVPWKLALYKNTEE